MNHQLLTIEVILLMIKLMGRIYVDISSVVLENAPKNAIYIAPTIQKDKENL